MTFSDWTMLGADAIRLRLEETATLREQINAFLSLISMSRESRLGNAILDMGHAEPHRIENAPSGVILHIAREAVGCPLRHLAVVDRGQRFAWWRCTVPAFRANGIRARLFVSPHRAIRWIETGAPRRDRRRLAFFLNRPGEAPDRDPAAQRGQPDSESR